MTPEDLDAIEARANAATAGPWYASQRQDAVQLGSHGQWWYPPKPRMEESPDAAFIAHARTDVPDLIARVRELEVQDSLCPKCPRRKP